jgi:hypothetical protein
LGYWAFSLVVLGVICIDLRNKISNVLLNPRVAFSAVCGIACLLLVVLWVRTRFTCDHIFGPLTSTWDVIIASRQGGISFRLVRYSLPDWTWDELSPEAFAHKIYPGILGLGLYLSPTKDDFVLRLPYWIFIVTTVAVATIPWIKWRFSLRTLLIATTLVAVVLWLAVAFR